jgi:hypothetical protein
LGSEALNDVTPIVSLVTSVLLLVSIFSSL